MDPRNERLVHKRMVTIACGETPSTQSNATSFNSTSTRTLNGNHEDEEEEEDDDDEGAVVTNGVNGHVDEGDNDNDEGGGSQYFLITPKLLPDLTYKRGMQVLCIASGEYMPEKTEGVDFRRCVDVGRAIAVR